METHEMMSVNNMMVETLNPTNIIAQLYSGKCDEKQIQNIRVEMNNLTKRELRIKCKRIIK
jgi:hypothetical protein